jgi:integrase
MVRKGARVQLAPPTTVNPQECRGSPGQSSHRIDSVGRSGAFSASDPASSPLYPRGEPEDSDASAKQVGHNLHGRTGVGMSARPRPIRGVEIRECQSRGGGYSYRVRFQNGRGERTERTFDCAQDALDFRARLRLLKRSGDLAVVERGRKTLSEFMADFWRLYAETRLAVSTRRKYRCLWNAHIERPLGRTQLRQITPLVLSEFILELQEGGVGTPTIRSCLGLLQGMFARAVEWDMTSVNVVKLIAKPRVRRARTIRPFRPRDIEALRRQMQRNSNNGLRDATLVSVLAYAGLRPAEALALEYAHLGERTIVIEQKWIDGEIVAGQKTTRPPRFPPLLDVLRADLHDYEVACRPACGLIFAQADGAPWRDHDWRDWRSRVWQPACEAIGLATITNTMIVNGGKRRTKRTYDGPVPYDLRHSFASLLIHEGKHSIVQIAEWMGHSPATLLTHYAHVLADGTGRSILPSEQAIKAARGTQPAYTPSSSTARNGHRIVTHWQCL